MTLLEGILDLFTIGLPEIAGEFVSGLLLRFRRDHWQPIAMGQRRQAEDAVRRLRRNHIAAWVHPAKAHGFEVIVRTREADVARALLNAPGSGRP
jgi:predicted nucleotidyltransferase